MRYHCIIPVMATMPGETDQSIFVATCDEIEILAGFEENGKDYLQLMVRGTRCMVSLELFKFCFKEK